MQIRFFNIPINDNGASQAEMNRFLAGQKVLEIEQQYNYFQSPFWRLCSVFALGKVKI